KRPAAGAQLSGETVQVEEGTVRRDRTELSGETVQRLSRETVKTVRSNRPGSRSSEERYERSQALAPRGTGENTLSCSHSKWGSCYKCAPPLAPDPKRFT